MTDVNYDFVTSFCRTKAVVTSHFAVVTPSDFLAKARLLDCDVNFIWIFIRDKKCIVLYKKISKKYVANCIMAAVFINKLSERCVLIGYGLIR